MLGWKSRPKDDILENLEYITRKDDKNQYRNLVSGGIVGGGHKKADFLSWEKNVGETCH